MKHPDGSVTLTQAEIDALFEEAHTAVGDMCEIGWNAADACSALIEIFAYGCAGTG